MGLLVADGGANDVLRVNPRTGKVSTFFVPPTAKTPACLAEGAQANPGTVGCDPVPTGLAVHGRYVYVSTISVYIDWKTPGMREDGPLKEPEPGDEMLDEVATVYLPLARLLNLYVAGVDRGRDSCRR